MKRINMFAAASVALLALSGCGTTSVFDRDRPDEFAVSRSNPLQVPAEFALPTPTPDAPFVRSAAVVGSRLPAPIVALVTLTLAAWALLVATCGALVRGHHHRLQAVVLVGLVGLVTALSFVALSAPDLALTQLSVEVVSTVLLLMGLALLPPTSPRESSRARLWRDGVLVDEPTDISSVWRDDLVTFAIGCSFSFEEALVEDGIDVRHITCGSNVPMYRTNIATTPAGVFHGPLVVSMRPLKPADAIRAIQITSRFPSVHGAPVHIGMPESIGIADINKPDYGDAVPIAPGELPVFWACGVTPQAVIAQVKPEFCITHAPGCMLITDLRNSNLASL